MRRTKSLDSNSAFPDFIVGLGFANGLIDFDHSVVQSFLGSTSNADSASTFSCNAAESTASFVLRRVRRCRGGSVVGVIIRTILVA